MSLIFKTLSGKEVHSRFNFRRGLALAALCLMASSCQQAKVDSSAEPISATQVAKTDSTANAGKTSSPLVPRGLDLNKTLQLISFGSCSHQDLPQPIWRTIEQNKPDLHLAMGDNVYASLPDTRPIAEQYRKQNNIPEYRSFREKTPFMAIWDDHDLGLNDGGADAPSKAEGYEAFLKNFNYVRDAREPGQEGLYHSKIFGKKKNRVQIIVLDLRYFRSPLVKINNAYVANEDPKVTMLGEAQWRWFEKKLKEKADVRFVVSSIQLIANDHIFERWGEMPRERQRFFNLLKQTKVKNLFVVSGDRHLASIAKLKIPGFGDLYDVTASSINRARDLSEKDRTYIGNTYGGNNFGLAKIDWNNRKVEFEIRDTDNKVMNSVSVKLK